MVGATRVPADMKHNNDGPKAKTSLSSKHDRPTNLLMGMTKWPQPRGTKPVQ